MSLENLLGASGSNAIMLSGALLILVAIAMTWIRPSPEEGESALMPFGKHRHISVNDRVIVGSDGSSASLFRCRPGAHSGR